MTEYKYTNDKRGFTHEQMARHDLNMEEYQKNKENTMKMVMDDIKSHRLDDFFLKKAEQMTCLGFEGLFRPEDLSYQSKKEMIMTFETLKERTNFILDILKAKGRLENWTMRRLMALSIMISGLNTDIPCFEDLDYNHSDEQEEMRKNFNAYLSMEGK